MVEKGDPTSCKGIFVVLPACHTNDTLGNHLYSYNLDARTDKEIKQQQEK